ncbi:MAG: hypothetical protein H0T83_09900 [Chthoniobacterales bacterium]|nr:hypothetical protein [Chthoniobacterales bacterium]
MTVRPLSRPGFILALALATAFKLWLVHGEEIVGSATQYDALWYLRSARHWYWGTPYDWLAFMRPCAYPLWIAGVHWLRLPLRLAIELLQLGGGLVLVLALRGCGISRGACLVAYLLLALHPVGFQQNDYTMSDTFYTALLWYVLGGLLLTLSQRRWWMAVATGFAIAVLWHTREEGILLVALVVLWIALLRNLRLIGTTCLTGAVLILAVYGVNDHVYRSFARSEMTAPVFDSLYHSLLRIKPAAPKPYAPITMKTLHRAFEVSPTFARLRAPLDGPLGEAWRVETRRRTGTPNEIGAGWIVWATRQAAGAEGVFASPKTARRFFSKAASEINAACDDGRLPTRFVLEGFLDPLAQNGGLARLPASTLRVAPRAFAQWSIEPLRDDSGLTNEELSVYNQMTSRRTDGVTADSGWAVFVEMLIAHYHWVVMILLHGLAAFGVVICLRGRHRLRFEALGLVMLLAGAVFLRAALLSWLDATAFDATQDRFLFPILPLWSALLVVLIALGAAAVRHPPAIEK